MILVVLAVEGDIVFIATLIFNNFASYDKAKLTESIIPSADC